MRTDCDRGELQSLQMNLGLGDFKWDQVNHNVRGCIMPYTCVGVKLVKQVRTCRKYLYANVGLAVETNLPLNSRPSDLDLPTNSNEHMHSS